MGVAETICKSLLTDKALVPLELTPAQIVLTVARACVPCVLVKGVSIDRDCEFLNDPLTRVAGVANVGVQALAILKNLASAVNNNISTVIVLVVSIGIRVCKGLAG